MALEGCYSCIKYLMFAFNFLFWLLGCVILGIGIWIKVDPTTIADVAKEDPQLQEFFEELHTYGYESAGAYVLIAVGSIIMVIGFLGCCGAIRESQCMLVLFFIFLTIIFIVLLVCGIYVIIAKDRVKTKISTTLKGKIDGVKRDVEDDKKFMKALQDKLECCGADHGIDDYDGFRDKSQCQLGNYNKPCAPLLHQKLSQNIVIIAGVAIGIASVMFLGMIFSMLLCCAIKENMA